MTFHTDNSEMTSVELALAAIDSAPDATVVVGEGGRIELVNRQVEAMFGYAPDELLGQPVEVLVPDEMVARHREHRSRFRSHPEPRPMGSGLDLLAKRADGSHVPVEISLSPLELEGVHYVVAAIRDVSSRVEAERKLRRSEARFRAAFDDGPVPMAVVAAHGRLILEANQAMVEVTGYPREELVGMRAVDLVHPDDLHPDDTLASDIARGLTVADQGQTVRLLRADGETRQVNLHVGPVAEHGPDPTLIVHAVDVTAMVEVEAANARQEALNEAVSEIRLAMLEGASRREGLGLLCRAARDVLDATSALVLSPTGAGDELAIEVSVGLAPEVASQFEFHTTVGVVGQAWTTGQVETTLPGDERVTSVNRLVLDRHAVGPIVVAPFGPAGAPSGLLVVAFTDDVPELTDVDLATIKEFASVAVSAIALAQAREAEQALAVLEDRERIGRDMHDSVIGRLFATGLTVQAVGEQLGSPAMASRLAHVVDELDEAIKEIRTVVFGIRPSLGGDEAVRTQLLAVAEDLAATVGFEPEVVIDGPLDELSPEVVEHLVLSLREACANVARHAGASSVTIEVRSSPAELCLVVTDDGIGLPQQHPMGAPASTGRGLRNIRVRAEGLGGRAWFRRGETGGTVVQWTVPLDADVPGLEPTGDEPPASEPSGPSGG